MSGRELAPARCRSSARSSLTTPLLGAYLARVLGGGAAPGDRVFLPVERVLYRLAGVDPGREQPWSVYALSLLAFSVVSVRRPLPAPARPGRRCSLNPTDVPGVPSALAFNTAASFVTNTNWQNYGGESTMSHLTQMAGLAVQNFVSAAVGIAVAVALIRGLVRRRSATIGNFWVDLTRTTTRVLLPLAAVVALVLVEPGRRAEPERQRRGARPSRARRRRSTAAPSRARRRSRSSARTAAGSRTPTRRTRSRTRPRSRTSSRCGRSSRSRSRSPSPSAGSSATAVRAGRSSARCSCSGSPPPGSRWTSRRTATRASRRSASAATREHGGQGGSLRRGRLGPVRGDDDRNVDGRGQRRPRQLHPARRRGAAREHDAWRGLAGRRRRRALRDARLRSALGLHRGPDGRADARVPRQEDPGGGDEAGHPLPPRRADADPGVRRDLRRPGHGEVVDPEPGRRTASPRSSTPSPRRRTTTARLSAA